MNQMDIIDSTEAFELSAQGSVQTFLIIFTDSALQNEQEQVQVQDEVEEGSEGFKLKTLLKD